MSRCFPETSAHFLFVVFYPVNVFFTSDIVFSVNADHVLMTVIAAGKFIKVRHNIGTPLCNGFRCLIRLFFDRLQFCGSIVTAVSRRCRLHFPGVCKCSRVKGIKSALIDQFHDDRLLLRIIASDLPSAPFSFPR